MVKGDVQIVQIVKRSQPAFPLHSGIFQHVSRVEPGEHALNNESHN